MTDLDHPISRQTNRLMVELAGHGFCEAPLVHGLQPNDGSVASEEHGIRVHADSDVVRVVLGPQGEVPAYRLLVPKHGLTDVQAIQIAAGIVRLVIEDRAEQEK